MLGGQSSVGMAAGGIFEDVLDIRWRAQVPRQLLESGSRRPGLSAKDVLNSKWIKFFAAKLDREARYWAPSARGSDLIVGARAS